MDDSVTYAVMTDYAVCFGGPSDRVRQTLDLYFERIGL